MIADAPCPLEASVECLTFGHEPGEQVEYDQELFDQFVVTNRGNGKEKFVFEQINDPNYSLEFSPASGTLAKGKSKQVKAKLEIYQPANIHFQFRLMTIDGRSVFIQIRVQCENGVFGVDPETLDKTQDGTHTVPAVLVDMKNNLGVNNGFVQEGIFRLAGEQSEIQQVKRLMNSKGFDFNNELDPNCMASLIKIWFRDLPTPIMNFVAKEVLMELSDPDECKDVFNGLPEEPKAILSWLLDLLSYTSGFSDQNKMTPTNIAICVAPNLYDISTPNPMEGLILSQKCAVFLTNVLGLRVSGDL
jgi:RhoGAP domain